MAALQAFAWFRERVVQIPRCEPTADRLVRKGILPTPGRKSVSFGRKSVSFHHFPRPVHGGHPTGPVGSVDLGARRQKGIGTRGQKRDGIPKRCSPGAEPVRRTRPDRSSGPAAVPARDRPAARCRPAGSAAVPVGAGGGSATGTEARRASRVRSLDPPDRPVVSGLKSRPTASRRHQ
jgi:hypothetical protein